jgi:hypothetical protein
MISNPKKYTQIFEGMPPQREKVERIARQGINGTNGTSNCPSSLLHN